MFLKFGLILVSLSSLVLANDYANKYVSKLKVIEKKVSKKDRYARFIDWANNLETQFKNDELAVNYYVKALDQKTRYNKSSVFFKIVSLYSKLGNYKKANSYYSRMRRYVKKKPAKASNHYFNHATKAFFKLPENNKRMIKNISKLHGSFRVEALEHNYQARIHRKEYKKALGSIDLKTAKKKSNYEVQVEYDLLTSVLKKKANTSNCAEEFGKSKEMMFVNYSHMTCSILLDLEKGKSLDSNKFNHLAQNIRKHYPHKKYVLSALRDLDK